MKTLIVLRHAKSDHPPGVDDHDRALSPRGRRAVPPVARWLRDRDLSPDLVLCSSARRTRETLELLTPALDDATQVEVADDLYLAPADDLLKRVQGVHDARYSVMLIGHNPGLQALVLGLAQRGADRQRVQVSLPTAAAAVISLPVPAWRDVGTATGELVHYVEPREL